MEQRLQKLISASGLMSRRAAEEYIAAGRVSVNGRVAALGDKADSGDEILVDGKPLPKTGERLYIMLNKPRGYVTTMSDQQGRDDVTALVKGLGARVYPVGRLDMYSEGLLLMTNDGDFANRVMHPSYEVKKVYLTAVSGEDIELAAEALRRPMLIDGYRVRGAEVEILSIRGDRAELAIGIHEGRNRQVRKMCANAGLRVLRLCRISEGELKLGDLKSGQWRHLTQQEIKLVLSEGE